MITRKLIIGVALLGIGAVTQAACPYPAAIEELPTGKTESQEEMIAAQKSVKEYVKSMEDYLTCLDEAVAKLGVDASEEQLLMRDKRHNAAVVEMEATAERFNVAVRAYKERTN